ncbi:MAG: pilus assembly protein [Acidaminococcaceae bacterium]|nr:pilus assembly protein [Acidaminococcaceae bacterium]
MKKLKQKGQAVIEFAVVLPLFLLFLFGIIYSGMLFYDYISLSNLARSAAREAAIVQNLTPDKIGEIETYYSGMTTNLLTHLYEPKPKNAGDSVFKVELNTPSGEDPSIEVTVRMERNVSSGLLEIVLPEDYTIIYFMRRDEQSGGTT